jgi:hypothetical protein
MPGGIHHSVVVVGDLEASLRFACRPVSNAERVGVHCDSGQ